MTDNVDWELKDRRIAWMSITRSLAEVQAALINSKLVEFKDLKSAMDDLGKSRQVEFNLYLGVESSEKPVEPGKNYICEKCNAGITEGVSNWSLENYGRALCMKCQGKEKK